MKHLEDEIENLKEQLKNQEDKYPTLRMNTQNEIKTLTISNERLLNPINDTSTVQTFIDTIFNNLKN